MTSVLKNFYINILDDIVNKCNNAYHTTIKIKTVDIKQSTYIESSKKINDNDPKFESVDIVRTSKYKMVFANSYISNWPEDVFMIKKVTILYRENIVLMIWTENKLLEFFTKKLQKTNQK